MDFPFKHLLMLKRLCAFLQGPQTRLLQIDANDQFLPLYENSRKSEGITCAPSPSNVNVIIFVFIAWILKEHFTQKGKFSQY